MIIVLIKRLLMPIILLRRKKLTRILKFLNFKFLLESKSLGVRKPLVKVTLKNSHDEYLLSILYGKLILGLIKIKI